MFLHTLVETKQVDLDELINQLKTNATVVNTGSKELGSLEYSFVVYCVEQQVNAIKESQEIPGEDDTEEQPPADNPDEDCGCPLPGDPCENLPDLEW